MRLENELQMWLNSSLFVLGFLVLILGMWILLLPSSFLRSGQYLGKWISTEKYFDAINRPRYQEGVIYRHHRLVGGVIILGALYTLYMLLYEVDIKQSISVLPIVINSYWSEWFYNTTYITLMWANALASIIGIVVFLRPSMLKRLEKILNVWIVPERKLKKLDETHEISIDIFPGGNPRLFGLAVVLGGLYIMLSMGVVLL